MTIRARHYAELLTADATDAVISTRLAQLSAIATVSRQLTRVATNPVTKPMVQQLLSELAFDPFVQSLVGELANTGRLHWVHAIRRAAETKLSAQGAAVPARVTLAHPVAEKAELTKTLTDLLGPISSIDITINPDELGGIRAEAAGRSFDTILDHRITKLRRMVRERNTR